MGKVKSWCMAHAHPFSSKPKQPLSCWEKHWHFLQSRSPREPRRVQPANRTSTGQQGQDYRLALGLVLTGIMAGAAWGHAPWFQIIAMWLWGKSANLSEHTSSSINTGYNSISWYWELNESTHTHQPHITEYVEQCLQCSDYIVHINYRHSNHFFLR